MDFRAKLISTLRAIRPVLEVPGVLVLGSEVPNLLEPDAACTLVVSQDVDIGVSVQAHEAVKQHLPNIQGFSASADEPSVWLPHSPENIEINFIGMDPRIQDLSETYVLEDSELPLMVFGALSLVRPGHPVCVGDLSIPLPRLAGLLLEKLVTDRTAVKGERDLLVALGLLALASADDLEELTHEYGALSKESRFAIRSNLTILSLMNPLPQMPDPHAHRDRVAALLRRFERIGEP